MLKIEDLKLGGELVCVDRNGLHNEGYACAQAAKLDKYIITGLCKQTKRVNFMIEHDMDWKDSNYLLIEQVDRFFKKKEQSQQYTFDDLIDVVAQAMKDGVIIGQVERVSSGIIFENFHDGELYKDDLYGIEKAIEWIKSLYKETFVIECEDDIERINDEYGRITLSNGEIIPKQAVNKIKELNNSRILFMVLKGATVEQERGRDDRS